MKKWILITSLILLTSLAAYATNLTIQSDKQSYKDSEKKAKFSGNVNVQIDDVTVKSPYAEATVDPKENKLDEATFFGKPYAYQIKKGKKSELKSDILKVSLLKKVITAQGNSQTIVTTDKKPTAIITAEEQEYFTKAYLMKAKGNVIVVYDNIKTFSNEGLAQLQKNNDLKELELIGNARIERDKSTLKADRFKYITATEIAISQGNAFSDIFLEDSDDRIQVRSNYQQYDKLNNVILASGNVHIKYQDYDAVGPKATLYPDATTHKFNRVVFTGRSKITEKARSIEADKIILYMSPKDFYAEGNVKTSIRNLQSMDDTGSNKE